MEKIRKKCETQKSDLLRNCLAQEIQKVDEGKIFNILKVYDLDPTLDISAHPQKNVIRNYFVNRLGCAFYSDSYNASDNSQEDRLVDHKSFFKLNSSFLTQASLLQFTRYCLEGTDNYDFTKGPKYRDDFLKKISESPQAIKTAFDGCQKRLRNDCDEYRPDSNKPQIKGLNACVTLKKVRSLYQAMVANSRILENYKDADSDQSFVGFEWRDGKRKEIFEPGVNEQKTLDELSIITSQDVSAISEMSAQDNDYAFKDDHLGAELFQKECFKNPLAPQCEKFIKITSAEELEGIEFEHELSSAILDRHLQLLIDDKEELKKYLVDQGLRVELKKLENNQEIKEIVTEIRGKYSKERRAYIEKLKEKFAASSPDAEAFEEKELSQLKDGAVQKKLQGVVDRLDVEKGRLQQAFTFHNVALQSFLTTGKKDPSTNKVTETGSYWTSLEREVEDLTEAGVADPYVKNLEKRLKNRKPSSEVIELIETSQMSFICAFLYKDLEDTEKDACKADEG